jgi:hypothetical protein
MRPTRRSRRASSLARSRGSSAPVRDPLRGSATRGGGLEFLGVILVTAIPFGIYDLVESAAVAGDSFPTTRVLSADGVVSLIGCCMGNPFINAVYIGHPGWKAMGDRITRSLPAERGKLRPDLRRGGHRCLPVLSGPSQRRRAAGTGQASSAHRPQRDGEQIGDAA